MSVTVVVVAKAFGFDQYRVHSSEGRPTSGKCWRLFTDMNLQSNDFELFGLAVQFSQDRKAIDARWKELQSEAHPDKFAAQGAAAQRIAMQWSVRINEAYQRLKQPLSRASYLCELHGAPIQAEKNTAMPTTFLMQQMAWREALDEADTLQTMEEIAATVSKSGHELLLKIEHVLDAEKNFIAAAHLVRSLMFIERFASEVDARIDHLAP